MTAALAPPSEITPGSGPPTTSASAACARPRPSRRSPDGFTSAETT